MTKDVDSFETAGIEAVLASLTKQYIDAHCVLKNNVRVYKGDLHVLRWYTEYNHRKKEAYASKQTQIQKGV